MDSWKLTASEVVARTKAGELTVEDYARSLLARIKERDEAVKAWAYLNPDYVIEQAKKLDQVAPEARGPLHGVAVAVKDVIYTRGEFESGKAGAVIHTNQFQICRRSSTLLYMRMTHRKWTRPPSSSFVTLAP